ncbi:MAG: DUF86 domain-containing protein [Clostridiales Family XIII bacterium]|jgi:uncharacterized protein with HEPN domain|nr:DUF86 domain-containing protein [Clostridiales Family XIII bacterium]
MKDSDKQRLEHMRAYCIDISKTIARFGDEFEIFISDFDYFNSVSMSILQIGELANSLSDEYKNQTKAQMPWGMIRNTRNILAHTYHRADKEIIWETARSDIPTVCNFCEEQLMTAEETDNE